MLFMTVPRISAIQQGRLAPLYGGTPQNLSPSPTLLVESHRAGPADSGTRLIPGQVLSLFLEPVGVRHSAEGFPSSRIGIPANSTVISMRGRTESVVWLGPAQILAVQVADSVMAAAASTLFDDEGLELTPNPGVQDARLSALLQVLRFEQASGFDSGRLFLDGIEQALAAHLVSHYRAREPGRRLRTGGLSPSCAKRVVDYIRSHLDGTLSLEALAACAGYSPAHFSRAFRETFQVTPHAFVLDRRIERATELLARPDHSLLDVAQLTGFQTQQHFSRVFRQRIGISPGAFRHAG